MAVTTRNSAKRHCALPQHQTELSDVTSTPESSVTTEPCGPVPRFKLRVKELNICVALKQPWRSRGALARRGAAAAESEAIFSARFQRF